MDEQQRQRILDDLRGFIKGDLLFDDLSRALYSTDASIFQIRPAGVVVPQDEEDLQNLVRYASESNIPLIARGAGSGVAGEALGKGLIVDMSRHFRQIGETGPDSIRVQPGVTCRQLNTHLARLGRRFAPDPASADQCTIGGMLATNASGARSLRYGYTRDHVYRLRAILDTGDITWLGKESTAALEGGDHLNDIVTATAVLLDEYASIIQHNQPKTPYNRCGYLLHDVLREETLDLPRLLVGSEGTLALFAEAELKTIPLPGGKSLVLLGFTQLEQALRAAQLALSTGPSACELVDRRLLTLARELEEQTITGLIPADAEAALLVEYESETAEEAEWAARRLPYHLSRNGTAPLRIVTALDPEEMQRLWHIREAVLPSLYGMRVGSRPVAAIEDVGVPPEQLPAYLYQVQEILQAHDTTASFLVHAGTGQVHTRPFLDLSRQEDVATLMSLSDEVHSLALDMGGTVSTQHGTGLARTPWVARQYPELYPVFRQLKAIFDPQNIFNPGKIVDPDPEISAWPLRQIPEPANEMQTLLRWQEGQMRQECLNCNGCGECRVEAPAQRMCPIFHATHTEAATPRAKANLLRHLMTNGEEQPQLSDNEVREIADLCVNCKMCALECPARVDIPKLMLEAKAANVAQHGLDRKDWFFARSEGFARWANTFPFFTNLVLANRAVRWLLEKMFGLSSKRRMPRFAWWSFLSQARRRGLSRFKVTDTPQVAYFVDVFANYNDPLIGEATVAVLQHNGIKVHVPAGQRGCGMAALAYGDVESAREIAQRNLQVLAEVAREGLPIVCSEPTAALMLSQDYLDLLGEEEAQLVASNTLELTNYLWNIHEQGKLQTDFQKLSFSVGHHVPCHLKALRHPPAGPQLLSLIPDLTVHTIDVSCSGMAGTFGMKKENYAVSLEAGRPMLERLKEPDVTYGSTECSTCRLQMEEGSGKRTLHPVQYLALAYGLLPEIRRRLEQPIGERML